MSELWIDERVLMIECSPVRTATGTTSKEVVRS
jgi:hypothetical protein